MISFKIHAGSLLALSLLVPHTAVRANFSTLTEQTRTEIIHDSAIAGLAVAAVSGSIALASDISNQSHTKRTFWQKLQHVDWASVVAISAGFGALGALVCGVYKYNNAPEWAFNDLESRVGIMKDTVQDVANKPIMQAINDNDPLMALEKVCIRDSFPIVSSVDRLNQAVTNLGAVQGYSAKEVASIKANLQSLTHCRVPEVANEATKLLAEFNAENITGQLNDFQTRLQDWIIRIKHSPLYVEQVERKGALDLIHAQAYAAQANAESARRMADAQQRSAYAQQRIANAKQTEATARLVEAYNPRPVIVRPIVVSQGSVVVTPAAVAVPRPPAPLKPASTVNIFVGKRK